MYFLKRNFKTIILYILSFGVVGTIAALLLVSNTYNYEEYYSVSEPLSTTQEDELSIQLNQSVNSHFDYKVASLDYSSESQYLQLTIDEASSEELSTIKSQFNEILDNSNISYSENIDTTISADGQSLHKTIVIVLSLIIGLFLGVIHAVMDKRIRTDEYVDYYLDQKSIGIF